VTELAKPLPRLKKKLLTTQQKKLPNFKLGAAGELRAAEYLKHNGFQIVDINVRYANFEVDIVALDLRVTPSELVFVEVKTRTTGFYGDPSEAVGWKKMRSMRTFAARFVRERKITLDYRFDAIAVLPNSIEHFENVSWLH
jgi:putative endonuclease